VPFQEIYHTIHRDSEHSDSYESFYIIIYQYFSIFVLQQQIIQISKVSIASNTHSA